MKEVKQRLRKLVACREGYRSIATAWNSDGEQVIRIDIETSSEPSHFADIPDQLDGIPIVIRRIGGKIRAEQDRNSI